MNDSRATGSFERYMELSPVAIAVTQGAAHTLVYANLAFRELAAVDTASIGTPIADAIPGIRETGLVSVFDRALLTATTAPDVTVAIGNDSARSWHCKVWPEASAAGQAERLIVEMRESSYADKALALQREVAERMLLSSLKERDASYTAAKSSQRATFLAAEGRRLAESLDELLTREAVAKLALPALAAWCIVDVFDGAGAMQRVRIVHPDAVKQVFLRDLEGQWKPEANDLFGLPAAMRSREPTLIGADQVDAALNEAAHGTATLHVLRAVGFGALLTVPLVVREALLGAVTFVSDRGGRDFSGEDIVLAEDLAVRSAMALDSAKLHGTALSLKTVAEKASRAKTDFLGAMSHELRTPLNAIGGYVDLLDMGLRGPMNAAQQIDLGRIRTNQRHLLSLITDLLNFVRLGSGRVTFATDDVVVHDVTSATVSMIGALFTQKGVECIHRGCDAGVVARADAEKVQQILINLLSNAIKFTPAGGCVTLACHVMGNTVRIEVADTGIGVPPDKLETIFDPFVQVKEGFAGKDIGIGLGLAISRDLARAMHGELELESELGRGSRFTLVLPRVTKEL
jgi:signal transduction histidine kinase